MKYQQIVCMRRTPGMWPEFRQFYVPVEEQDGRLRPCGPLREEFVHRESMLTNVSEYEYGGHAASKPLSDITPPEGWEVVSRLPLRDDYVPQSQEVLDETQRRAVEYLKSIGVIKDD